MSGRAVDFSPASWRKSSYSNGNGGACVEVACAGPAVAVRDSKDPGAVLTFTPQCWRTFLRALTDTAITGAGRS